MAGPFWAKKRIQAGQQIVSFVDQLQHELIYASDLRLGSE